MVKYFTNCRKGSVIFALACVFFSSVSVADTIATGRDLIEKMSSAMQGLNYAGTFVYSHDGDVESMSIHHSAVEGIERERLLSLNGEPREIIRNAQSVVCIWPGTKTVAVTKSVPRTPFPEFDAAQLAQLELLYRFKRGGMDRVAGRVAEVVDIHPLDNYRYGYRLWIDAETYLMLRSVMSDNQNRIIEQVMFTDVEYPDHIPASTFEASLEGDRQEWVIDLDKPMKQPDPNSDIPVIADIKPPAGFALMSDKVVMLPEQAEVRRIMYTDGLASLSVYVTRASGDKNELHGMSGMGAVHAYGVVRDEWHVTVVGEVPGATVTKVGDSLTLANR